jgi:hypothetical protein
VKRLLNAALLLVLMLTWAAPAWAQGGHEQPGQVIFGDNRELQADDIIKGDLVIFGGNLSMADARSTAKLRATWRSSVATSSWGLRPGLRVTWPPSAASWIKTKTPTYAAS